MFDVLSISQGTCAPNQFLRIPLFIAGALAGGPGQGALC